MQCMCVWLQMESVPYIFSNDSMKKLLANKYVVFIGDSGKLRCSFLHGFMVCLVYKALNGLSLDHST